MIRFPESGKYIILISTTELSHSDKVRAQLIKRIGMKTCIFFNLAVASCE
jgi:hypothetical protein